MSTETTESQQPEPEQQEIVAKAATYYRMTRYIMVAMLIGMGGWFLYDGYVKYPKENQEDIAKGNEPQHSNLDLMLQRALGFALPPIGVATLIWSLYNSRAFRLTGQTLDAPGHDQPITFDQIRRLDKKLWDRKGIAYVDYEVANAGAGQTRTVKLDDFVYERKPIDDIYERVEQYVSAQLAAGDGPPDTSSERNESTEA